MPTVHLTSETYEAVQKLAVPLEDTFDSVLQRLLRQSTRSPQDARPTPARRPEGSSAPDKTPQADFAEPLIQALQALGGRATAKRVIDGVGELFGTRLRPGDHMRVSSGEPRWRNAVRWQRAKLIEQGRLRPDSPTGIWELA